MSLRLPLRDIEDVVLQRLFDLLNNHFLVNHQLDGFKHFELAFTSAGTSTIPHNLGFQPKDVIQTSLTGSGALTWNYDLFDRTNISVTVTGPCVVRAFIGAYQES